MKLTILKLVFTSLALIASFGVADAHEGEDHGTPEPFVAAPGEAILAATGGGAAFDAVLKYKPFAKGEQVSLTLYLVSLETNRPVGDAAVSASLSEGDKSTTVAFQPKVGGPVGAYSATVTPESDATMSWLFDMTAGSDSELIAIGGFRAVDKAPGKDVGDALPRAHESNPPRMAILVSLGSLLAVGAFAAGRFTARKGVSVR